MVSAGGSCRARAFAFAEVFNEGCTFELGAISMGLSTSLRSSSFSDRTWPI